MDASEPVGLPLRLAVVGLVAALPLTEGYEFAMPWFNTMANASEDVRIAVTGVETVTTPAGTFEAYKVELRGSQPENIVYVSTALPRKIVHIDVIGQPMHFLRRQ